MAADFVLRKAGTDLKRVALRLLVIETFEPGCQPRYRHRALGHRSVRMEQVLLNHFRQHRHAANHEIRHGVTFRDLANKWVEFLRAKSS